MSAPQIADAVNELIRVKPHVELQTGLEGAAGLLEAETSLGDALSEASFEAESDEDELSTEETGAARFAFA